MATGTITKRAVDAIKPTDADQYLWDDALPGFGLKVTPGGSKVYLLKYRMGGREAATRRYTIGKHGPLTPDQARKRAQELASMVAQGIDPRQLELDTFAAQAEAKRQVEAQARLDSTLLFEKVAERWLEDYEIGHRPRSHAQAKSAIDKHLVPALRGKPLPSITRADVQGILNGIPARQPATRRTVYAYASILFGWALQRGDIAENPLLTMAKPKAVKARDRVLADDELATIWRATETLRAPLGAFYRVLLLTGQRREEVAGMKWDELDRATATWIIPAGRAKNDTTHIVPLSPAVVDELDRLALAKQVKDKINDVDAQRWPKSGAVLSIRGGVSLSCFSQAKTLLDAEVTKARGDDGPMDHWRVHDLRRTMATGFQRLGIRFEVTEATLNHVSGAKGGVAGIYQRHDWAEEKRTALEAWAKHVASIIQPPEQTNIVPMRKAEAG